MRKHEISYHEKTNIIEFSFEFCTHSKRIDSRTTNKEKNISFEKKFFLNQSITRNLTSRSKTRENTLKSSSKFFFEKMSISINQLINQRIVFFEKTKNRSNLSIRRKSSMQLKISDSILMSSKSLTRKKKSCLR